MKLQISKIEGHWTLAKHFKTKHHFPTIVRQFQFMYLLAKLCLNRILDSNDIVAAVHQPNCGMLRHK